MRSSLVAVMLSGIVMFAGWPAKAVDLSTIDLQVLTGGLSAPLAVRHANDDSGRLFIVQQGGEVRIWENNALLATPFLDISDRTTASGERGLLGLAFHPLFASNGQVYVNYTASGVNGVVDGSTVISRFTLQSNNPDQLDASSEQRLMVVRQDFSNHNGGDIHFGPDGYLYIGLGDGGSGNDPCNRAQTTAPAQIVTGNGCVNEPSVALLGKMLRIDVDTPTPAGSNGLCAANPDGSAAYAVPNDNAFVGDNSQCAEIWSTGLRNPYRFSFDRKTGEMWIADVGQNTWEEINREPFMTSAGSNYGWKPCEGLHPTGNSDPDSRCGFASVAPAMEYRTGQNNRCSVIGGYRYRGQIDALRGCYLFGDFCSSEVFRGAQPSRSDWAFQLLGNTFTGGPRGFGEDQAGEVYIVAGDSLYQITGPDGGLIFNDQFDANPLECRLASL